MRLERYSRLLPLEWINKNFEIIEKKKVLLIGAGALGSNITEILVRAGINNLTLIDRDFVEFSDLLTSPLYNEEDAKQNKPKVYALEEKLKKLNSNLKLKIFFENLSPQFIKNFNFKEYDIIIDAVDNLETRFLINEISFKEKIPWIHGACVSERGEIAFFKPWEGPCYRCLFNKIPKRGRLETCETHGINPVVAKTVAGIQSDIALKYLINGKAPENKIFYLDFSETYTIKEIEIKKRKNCPLCTKRIFEFITKKEETIITFCSEKSAMVLIKDFDIDEIEKKWIKKRNFKKNEYYIGFEDKHIAMKLYKGGKLFIKSNRGVDRKMVKTLISEYIGE